MPTIEPRGTRFRAKVRVAGHPTQTETFATEAQALVWGHRIEQSLRTGTTYADPSPAFSVWLEKYIRDEAPKWVTGKDKVSRLRALLSDPIALLPVALVRPTDIDRVQERLEARGLKPQTVRHYLQDCSAVWGAAKKKWRATTLPNPFHDIEMPRVSAGRKNRVSPSVESQISVALKQHVNPFYAKYMQFLLETAMRVSEPLTLRQQDIDWEHKVATVVGKGAQQRQVPLSPVALSLLREAIALRATLPEQLSAPGGGYYDFSGYAKDLIWPLTYSGFSRAWTKAAGSTGAWIHDLRRERATRLLEQGMSTINVKVVTGHASTAMLDKHYAVVHAQKVATLLGDEAFRASPEGSTET